MIQGVTSSFCGSLCLPINGDDHIVLVCYGCCDRVPQAWGLTQWKLMVSQFWKLEVLGQDVGRVGSFWGPGGRMCSGSPWLIHGSHLSVSYLKWLDWVSRLGQRHPSNVPWPLPVSPLFMQWIFLDTHWAVPPSWV